MDRAYDKNAAGQKLEELALDRYNSAHSGMQLSRVASVTAHYEAVLNGRTWSLVHRNTNEELIVSFQGIVVKKDLPPFTERLGTSHHVRYLRQSISLSGLDTSTFMKVVDATAGVHAVLSRSVGINNTLDCGMIGSLNNSPVIELSNRYFRPRQAGFNTNDEVVLSPDVDPHGYLTRAAANLGLYHSEENVVQYFQREGSGDESYKYSKVKPLIFSVGDIVEVQASFVMFPLKEGKYKSAMVLRVLTLLDGTFTQARVKSMAVQNIPVGGPSVLKRKVGYGEETLSVTRAKLAKMEVDEHHSVDDEISVISDGVSVIQEGLLGLQGDASVSNTAHALE